MKKVIVLFIFILHSFFYAQSKDIDCKIKFVDGKDYQEISDILRKPIGTIGTLINRAKKMLAQEIEKYKAGVEND